MHELLALTARHLRTTLRGRAARAGALLAVIALVAAVAWPGGDRGEGLVLLFGLLAVVLLVGGFAAGAGAALPEDRVAGRETWLSALAPPGWQRRLSVVLAAWLLAVGAGLVGGVLLGGLVTVVRPDLELREHEPLRLPADAVLAAGDPPVVLSLPPAAASDLEVEVRPLFRLHAAPIDRVQVAWWAGEAAGSLEASVRGPLRLHVPAGADRLQLASQTGGVRLRLVEARRLGGARAPWLALVWTGLLLGVLAGAVVPVAVLLSRATTAQTAVVAASLLLLVGATQQGWLTLAGDLRGEGLLAVAPALLRTVAWCAPDVPLLHLVGEAGALRTPATGVVALLAPALLYTTVVAIAACWPAPRRCVEGVNP